MKIVDSVTGRIVDSDISQLVDKLLEYKNTKDVWFVIEKIIEAWYKTEPKEWKSYILDIKDKRDSRRDDFGSSSDGSMRYLVDIPDKIYTMIRIMYSVDELPMDKKFLRELARRFPALRVAKKI